MRSVACVAICSSLLAMGCGAGARSPDTSAAAAEAVPTEGRSGVRLDESQLQQVRIDEIAADAAADAIKATGTVEFNADRMSRILPPVSGQVQDLSVNVGDPVRKGDVLFVLSSREVAAAIADHLASRTDLELAEKTFAMTQDLFQHDAASRIALQQSENELAKSRAKVRQTREVLQFLGLDIGAGQDLTGLQSRIPVRAPIGGTVIERTVTTGQVVGPENAPLVVIADLSSVWVQADVFERDLRYISVGQTADVTTTAYPNDRFKAHVARIGTSVDAQTRTAKVRFLVANPDARLKPGMFTATNLYLPAAGSSLTVPAKAVFVENNRSFAYLQTGRLEFTRREIETVPSGTDRIRVVRGLKPGDRVVADGALLLRSLEADSPADRSGR